MSARETGSAVRFAQARPAVAASLLVATVVTVSTLIRILVGSNAPGPWVFVDELIYSDLGRSAFDGFSIRGVPTSGYGYGYPLLIAPAYAAFENLVTAFAVVKAINALTMSLTAVPVYFIARTIVGRRWAAVAGCLAVAVPAMAYTSMVMTESAFYPLFATASMLIVLALRRPTLLRQVLIWPVALLCFEVRPQGAALIGAWMVAVVAVGLADGFAVETHSRARAVARSFARFWATFLVLALACAALALYVTRSGKSLSSLLGAYAIAADDTSRYHIKSVAAWSLMHVSELALWLGVIPFAALLVLVCVACMRGAPRDLRVFAIASAAIGGAMVVLVGAFVVFSNVGRIEERNLFYIGIFPLIALCWWISGGLPRAGRWFPMVLVVSAGLPLTVPYATLLNQTAASDTFGLYVPWALSEHLGDPNLTVYAVAVTTSAAAALMLFVATPRAWILFAVVLVWFLATSVAVDVKTDRAARGAVAQGISGSRDWIDRAVGGNAQVAVVYPGTMEPLKVWQNEFFNRSIDRVFTVDVPLPGGLPDTVINTAERGRITDRAGKPISAGLVLEHDSATVAGQVIARDASRHMNLVRVDQPLRFVDIVSGIFDDGWTGAAVEYTNFDCVVGTVKTVVRLDGVLHPDPVVVTPYVDNVALAPVSVAPDGTPQAVAVRVKPSAHKCHVHYSVDPVIAPAQVPGLGSTDPRPLGVLMEYPILVAG